MDISGKWPRDSRGYQYVLCIVEAATRYSIFVPLKLKTAKVVLDAFFSRYVAYFGVPNHIHSDVGTEFRNQLFEGLCTNLEIVIALHLLTNIQATFVNGSYEIW